MRVATTTTTPAATIASGVRAASNSVAVSDSTGSKGLRIQRALVLHRRGAAVHLAVGGLARDGIEEGAFRVGRLGSRGLSGGHRVRGHLGLLELGVGGLKVKRLHHVRGRGGLDVDGGAGSGAAGCTGVPVVAVVAAGHGGGEAGWAAAGS